MSGLMILLSLSVLLTTAQLKFIHISMERLLKLDERSLEIAERRSTYLRHMDHFNLALKALHGTASAAQGIPYAGPAIVQSCKNAANVIIATMHVETSTNFFRESAFFRMPQEPLRFSLTGKAISEIEFCQKSYSSGIPKGICNLNDFSGDFLLGSIHQSWCRTTKISAQKFQPIFIAGECCGILPFNRDLSHGRNSHFSRAPRIL